MKKNIGAQRRERKRKILRFAGHAGIVLLTLVVFVVAGLYSVMLVLAKGPSPTARDLFVRSVMETSAVKFLAVDVSAFIAFGSGKRNVVAS